MNFYSIFSLNSGIICIQFAFPVKHFPFTILYTFCLVFRILFLSFQAIHCFLFSIFVRLSGGALQLFCDLFLQWASILTKLRWGMFTQMWNNEMNSESEGEKGRKKERQKSAFLLIYNSMVQHGPKLGVKTKYTTKNSLLCDLIRLNTCL